jgi:hypothetical protein
MSGHEQRTDHWRRDERKDDPENNKSEQRHDVPPAMTGFHTREQARMQARRGIVGLYGGMGVRPPGPGPAEDPRHQNKLERCVVGPQVFPARVDTISIRGPNCILRYPSCGPGRAAKL